MIFEVADRRGTHHWLVELGRRQVAQVEADAPADVKFAVHPSVLNDCARIRMFSTWTPSKRLRIHIAQPDRLKLLYVFLTLLDLYELEMLPLRRNLAPRVLGIRLRRWREAVELVALASRQLFGRQRRVADLYPI